MCAAFSGDLKSFLRGLRPPLPGSVSFVRPKETDERKGRPGWRPFSCASRLCPFARPRYVPVPGARRGILPRPFGLMGKGFRCSGAPYGVERQHLQAQDARVSETLDNIFASYVNQNTLEDAASWMANLTRHHPEMAEDFITALQHGMVAASKNDSSVITAVNASGYQVSTAKEAGDYCLKLLGLYTKQLKSEKERTG